MKKLILLLLFLPCVASAQFPMMGAWQSTVGFSPASIDSLRGWYVADDLVDSLGKANGDSTYIWPNRAKWYFPNTLGDLFQTTNALKPFVRDSSGVRWVRFDGVDDWMRTTDGTLPQPTTIVLVLKKKNGSTAIMVDGGGTATQRNIVYEIGGAQARMFAGTEANFDKQPDQYPVDSTAISISVYNGASSFFRIRGLQSSTLNTGAYPLVGCTLGATYVGTEDANILVYALYIYHKALTAQEISDLETYIINRPWGAYLP